MELNEIYNLHLYIPRLLEPQKCLRVEGLILS